MRPEKTPRTTPRTRDNPSRRRCVPPALMREARETLEASAILEEVPGDAGLVLWESLRDVTLWASVPPMAHAGLFQRGASARRRARLEEAGIDAEMEAPFETLLALLGDPAAARPAAVTAACLALSHRLAATGALQSSICYAQAAALASPLEPQPALLTGRAALRAGSLARAETWFRRTAGLARRATRWDTFAAAYVELGSLRLGRGDAAGARALVLKALRACKRHRVRPVVRGEAYYVLFRLARQTREREQARRYARVAMRAWRGDPVRQHRLAQEIAEGWLEQGNPARAALLLQKLVALREDPAGRLESLALLALAAARAGARRTFEKAWPEASRLARELDGTPAAARAEEQLSRAAAAREQLSRAAGRPRHPGHVLEPRSVFPPS